MDEENRVAGGPSQVQLPPTYRDLVKQLLPSVEFPGDNSSRTVPPGVSILVYGVAGTRKTTTFGEAPGVLYASTSIEGGAKTLAHVPKYLGAPIPPSQGITTIAQWEQLISRLLAPANPIMYDPLTLNRPGPPLGPGPRVISVYEAVGIRTLVVDQLTTLVDMWIGELLEKRGRRIAGMGDKGLRSDRDKDIPTDPAYMEHQDYGLLKNLILKDWMARLHAAPNLNVVWILQETELYRTTKDPKGQSVRVPEGLIPAVEGSSKKALVSMCDLVFYTDIEMRTVVTATGKAVQVGMPVWYTQPTPKTKWMRHRYADAFPHGYLCDPNNPSDSAPRWRYIADNPLVAPDIAR